MKAQKEGFILILIIISIILFSTFLSAVQLGPGLIENEQWGWNVTKIDGTWGAYDAATAFGDVDNDGDLDLALSGTTSGLPPLVFSKIYINNGTSLEENCTWQQDVNLTSVFFSSLAWGDVDNDGRLDLALTGCSGATGSVECNDWEAKLYTNNGTTLEENISWQQNLTGVYKGAVNFGDVDLDGDLDLALIGCSSSADDICLTDEAKIYLNNGTSLDESEQWQNNLTDVYYGNIAFGDIDNDGDLDLVLTGRDTGNIRYLDVYLNNGTSFVHDTTWSENLVDVQKSSPVWGDYDNDGDLDLIVMGFTDSLYVYENNGGTLLVNQSHKEGVLASVFHGSLTLGDYDNDGNLDLATSGREEETHIYGNVEGVFDVDTVSERNLTNLQFSAIVFGDVDNDDDLDLFLTGSSTSAGYSYFYINNQSETYANTPPIASISFENYSTAGGIFFGWGEGNDTETNVTGLYYNLRMGSCSGCHDIVSGIYGGGEDNGYFGNMMQRRNITLKNTRFATDTTYYWSVQTIDTALNGSNWSEEQQYTTTADITYPEITLDYPTNFFNQSASSVIFNYTVVETNIDTCELEGNWSSGWHLNESIITPPISETNGTSQVELEEGQYIWNVICNDTTNNRNYATTNFTITMDSTPPLVSLENPEDNATNSTSNSIDFVFNVTDFLDIVNCSLIINDEENFTVNNTPKDTAGQNITVFLFSGDYNWTINCTDSQGHK